jgi:hypothetical protein
MSDDLETWCPQCGADVDIDEDGCCQSCGADAIGEGASDAHSARRQLAQAVADKTRAEQLCVRMAALLRMYGHEWRLSLDDRAAVERLRDAGQQPEEASEPRAGAT